MVPDKPMLHLVMLELKLEMVVSEEPTLPLLERWPLGHPHQNYHSLKVHPKELVEGCWGCMQLTKCNLLTEIFHKLTQFLICEVAKLCLEVLQSIPIPVRVTSRWIRITLPLWGWRLQLRGITSPYSDVCPDMRIQRSHSSNGNHSSCNSIAFYGTTWCPLHLFHHVE